MYHMADKIHSQLEKKLGIPVRTDEPMRQHTSFRTGGPAQYYIDVSTEDKLIRAVKAAWVLNIPVFIFGSGANIVVSEKGIEGLVIKNNCRSFSVLNTVGKMTNQQGEWKLSRDKSIVAAEGGVIMNQLVRFTIDEGLAGLEDQLGLPGTIGGAVAQNASCAEKSTFVGDCVYKARILTKTGEIKAVDRSYFRFSFDKSTILETGEIILTVYFLMTTQDKTKLWEKATQALAYRTSKIPKTQTGSTFRNISELSKSRFLTPADIPSLADLVEKAGLDGLRVGDAVVAASHPNFIINADNATARDVVLLSDLVKKQIFQKLGIELWFSVTPIGRTS